MLSSTSLRRALLALVLLALAAGFVAGPLPWIAAAALVAAVVAIDLVRGLLRGAFGVDVIALLAILGALVLQEHLAAIIIAVMIAGGLLCTQPWVWGIGLAHVGVCVLFVALVNTLSWGPRQAERPFIGMGAAYNALSGTAALLAWGRRAG